jgi:hypothetical protein
MSIELFTQLQTKGYVVTNKRVLGNPKFTSEETKVKDLVQEHALVTEWLRVIHGICIEVKSPDTSSEGYYFGIHKPYKFGNYYNGKNDNFHTPQEAVSAAIDYTLKELI